MPESLTLKSFRNDYGRLVVRFGNEKEALRLEAKKLIDSHYSTTSQLRRDCLAWLRKQS